MPIYLGGPKACGCYAPCDCATKLIDFGELSLTSEEVNETMVEITGKLRFSLEDIGEVDKYVEDYLEWKAEVAAKAMRAQGEAREGGECLCAHEEVNKQGQCKNGSV